MKPTFDTYYNYAQLAEVLSTFAAEHPAIVTLGVIGKSHEGRDIPLVILTNRTPAPTSRNPRFMSMPTSMRPS